MSEPKLARLETMTEAQLADADADAGLSRLGHTVLAELEAQRLARARVEDILITLGQICATDITGWPNGIDGDDVTTVDQAVAAIHEVRRLGVKGHQEWQRCLNARARERREAFDEAITAVRARSLWTVVTYESLYSTKKVENSACLSDDLVKRLEALRDQEEA